MASVSILQTSLPDRARWESSISQLVLKANAHTSIYSMTTTNGLTIHIHPNVYSPKYFPESAWYARQVQAIVQGKEFLEVGVGSGIISLYVAQTGSRVHGVDINPDAVEISRKNFEVNGLQADLCVSDVYGSLDDRMRVDYIFWNHPWQYSSNIVGELKSEKTLDEGYKALTRYIAEGHKHLREGGAILIGTSCFANLDTVRTIAHQHEYAVTVEARGTEKLEDGTEEEYFILRLIQQSEE
ncbi:hypothetical protein BGZ73_008848 [Actinomortierella ambigua]|nr:hypothetical protein BGZ73_008848 [Actinomortierella ambigua]